ncbi:MAG: hypothetical protein ACK4FN_02840 [Acinetobacter johnsonii]
MNDPILSVERLEELVELANKAESGFERAAVYAAASCLELEFRRKFDITPAQINSYDLEKAVNAIWHIKAMVGYNVTNNHPKGQHESWAFGALMTLRDNLDKAD